MPVQIKKVQPPTGLNRLGFRFPIWFYRLGFGSLFGKRFVCLTHTGRRSGLPRLTVLEVVRYEANSDACVVAAGFGDGSDWVRNVIHDPHIIFTVGRLSRTGIAENLDPDSSGQELVIYVHQHPIAWRELYSFMGYRLDVTEQDTRELGKRISMFLLRPV